MSHLARRQKPISTHKIGVQGQSPLPGVRGSPPASPLFPPEVGIHPEIGVQGAKPLAGGLGVTPSLSPLPTGGGHSSREQWIRSSCQVKKREHLTRLI